MLLHYRVNINVTERQAGVFGLMYFYRILSSRKMYHWLTTLGKNLKIAKWHAQ